MQRHKKNPVKWVPCHQGMAPSCFGWSRGPLHILDKQSWKTKGVLQFADWTAEGQLGEKKLSGTPTRKEEDNIKIHIQEIYMRTSSAFK